MLSYLVEINIITIFLYGFYRLLFTNYCCPIKPLYTAISSLNPAEIGMISSYFKFQAPTRIMTTLLVGLLPG